MGVQSNQGELNSHDWKKWRKDALYFFLGVIVIYLGTIGAKLQEPFHTFSVRDLIPNAFMWGAIIHYLSNTIQNLVRKWNEGG